MILLTSSYSSTFVFETNLNTNVLYKHMWKRSFPQESLQSCGKLSVPNDSAACRTTMSSSNLKKLFPVYQNFTGPVQRVKAFCVTWLPDLKKWIQCGNACILMANRRSTPEVRLAANEKMILMTLVPFLASFSTATAEISSEFVVLWQIN